MMLSAKAPVLAMACALWRPGTSKIAPRAAGCTGPAMRGDERQDDRSGYMIGGNAVQS
jgi:hypothetical protein